MTPLRAVRSELPANFVATVERALAREPERRWANAAEFERELLAVLGADAGTAAARVRQKVYYPADEEKIPLLLGLLSRS